MVNRLRHGWQRSNGVDCPSQGYTLMELLVVVLVIGILGAIAVPVWLRQVDKAREIEALQAIRQMNEQQKAFYLEKSHFTESLNDLSLSLNRPQPASACILGALRIAYQQTNHYCYGMKSIGDTQSSTVFHIALSKQPNFASQVGVVYLEDANLVSCGPLKVSGCSSVSLANCLDLLFKAKANPKAVCSSLK